MADTPIFDPEHDPRASSVLALAPTPNQRVLLAWLLVGFERLEQTEFGELEPVGVAAPTTR